MNGIYTRNEFETFENRLDKNQKYGYKRWERVKNQFQEWDLSFEFLYITDAKKVYQNNSLAYKHIEKDKRKKFLDIPKSKHLLDEEIEFCSPDRIILLGDAPLELLDKSRNYASVVDHDNPIFINNRMCIVSPFPSSRSKSQPRFEQRLANATRLIRANDAF